MSGLKKRGLLLVSILLIASLAVVSGCSGAKAAQPAKQEETVTITHAQGETVVKKNPQKVVVFDWGALDTLEQLGIQATAWPQGVAPSYQAKYIGGEYINVGDIKNPNFEKITSLKPDLIIISGRQSRQYAEFAAIAPTINLQLDSKNYMSSFKTNMRQLALVFDKQEQMDQELKKIDDQVATIRAKVASSNHRALAVMAIGEKFNASGPGSRFALIFDVLGMESVWNEPAAPSQGEKPKNGPPKDGMPKGDTPKDGMPKNDTGRPNNSISNEYIAQTNPDYLFVVDRNAAIGQGGAAKQLLNNEIVNRTNAAINGNIVYLDSSVWYLSGGGLMSMSYMLNEIDQAIH
ncbi:MAG: siderophore ABC transporter substrate-binding protein [Sporomusa sp.]